MIMRNMLAAREVEEILNTNFSRLHHYEALVF